MTMVIDLGLARFYHRDDAGHEAGLRSLVEAGCSKRLRDFVGDRVLEVRRVRKELVTCWLEGEARKAIDDDLAALGALDVDFAWDELDTMGAYFIQDLAFHLDGPTPPAEHVALMVRGESLSLRVIDVRRSLKQNWQGNRHPSALAAAKLHRFAIKHRFIIHSA